MFGLMFNHVSLNSIRPQLIHKRKIWYIHTMYLTLLVQCSPCVGEAAFICKSDKPRLCCSWLQHSWIKIMSGASYGHLVSPSDIIVQILSLWTMTMPLLICPSAAYMRQWIGSALAQIMACRLLGAKMTAILSGGGGGGWVKPSI